MSLWSQPQPPQVIGPTASTLPLPHDPIPAQGSQPPRRQVAAAMMMVAVLASWPLDLEPRLQKPNDQQTKIAPLTLTYGSQPTPSAFLSPTELRVIVASWPLEYPPVYSSKISAPNIPPPPVVVFVPYSRPRLDLIAANQDSYTVGLIATFVVGQAGVDPPPTQYALKPSTQAQIAAAWVDASLAPTPQKALNVAPLTLPTGTRPTPTSFLSVTELQQIVASWPVDVGPTLPFQRLTSFVVASPAVSQPPRRAPLSSSALTGAIAAWTESWGAQSAAPTAAWNVPPPLPVTLPHIAPPALIWTSWEPPFVAPPRPVSVAVLTLPAGNQPPPQPPLARVQQATIAASWPIDSGPLVAWPNATPSRIVPLTLPTGPALRPHGPLAIATLMQAVAAWVQTWGAQTAADNAGWNVPLAPFNPAWASQSNKTVGPRITPR